MSHEEQKDLATEPGTEPQQVGIEPKNPNETSDLGSQSSPVQEPGVEAMRHIGPDRAVAPSGRDSCGHEHDVSVPPAHAASAPLIIASPGRAPAPDDLPELSSSGSLPDVSATQRANDGGVHKGDWPHFEGYEVLRPLGKGGMGVVYLARDLLLHSLVAIKSPLARSPNGFGPQWTDTKVEQFLDEARQLARVRHPHVVPIFKADKQGDLPFFVMQYVEGMNADALTNNFARCTPHSLPGWDVLGCAGLRSDRIQRDIHAVVHGDLAYYRLVASWMAGVAEGLHQLHKLNVLHRDVKPRNLILHDDGRLMLADFGLARSSNELAKLDNWGVTGTYQYQPPEKAVGDWAEIDHRSDIYSLGATFYEFLTYRKAYPKSGRSVLQDIAQHDPVQPRRMIREIPIELERICMRAMERDPKNRFATAKDMADALHQWIGADRGTTHKSRAARWQFRLVASLLMCSILSWYAVYSFEWWAERKLHSLVVDFPAEVVVNATEEDFEDRWCTEATALDNGVASHERYPVVHLALDSAAEAELGCGIGYPLLSAFERLWKGKVNGDDSCRLTFLDNEQSDYQVRIAPRLLCPHAVDRYQFVSCKFSITATIYYRDSLTGPWRPLDQAPLAESTTESIHPTCTAQQDQLLRLAAKIVPLARDLITADWIRHH